MNWKSVSYISCIISRHKLGLNGTENKKMALKLSLTYFTEIFSDF